MGRKDDQVKINGIRVEPMEIKRALLRLAAVQDAEIVAVRNAREENELACYYIAGGDIEETIRAHLAAELSPSLMPVAFIRLKEFPRTINGKIDKRALPRISKIVIPDETYVPVRTDTEKKLEIIWRDLLSLDRIGRTAEFLKIGGSSLILIGMVSRIFHEFGISLTFADVFARQTIGQLAAWIDQLAKEDQDPIVPIPPKDRYALTHAQRRLWVHDRIGNQKHLYNIVQAFEVGGGLHPAYLLQALIELCERHEILRTVFVDGEDGPMQRVLASDQLPPAFFYYGRDEFRERWGGIGRLLEAEQRREFDLTAGPLFTATIGNMDAGVYCLVLNQHHIISDGWSQDVLMNDLLKLYNGKLQEREPDLRPLTIQFRDYADWINRRLQGERGEELERYWKLQFSEPFDRVTIPYCGPAAGDIAGTGNNFDFRLDDDLTDQLRVFAGEMQVTGFIVLFAAVQILLNRYTGSRDLVTGVPFLGRNRKELDGQAGLFVNLLPLRMRLREEDSLATVVEDARDCITGAYEHQDYPIDLLDALLEESAVQGRMLFFNILIQSQNDLQQTQTAAGGISVVPIPMRAITCKADITFNFQEKENGILVSMEYDTIRYDEPYLDNVRKDLGKVVLLLVSHPEMHLGEITLQKKYAYE